MGGIHRGCRPMLYVPIEALGTLGSVALSSPMGAAFYPALPVS
jgi:hypothetical protein